LGRGGFRAVPEATSVLSLFAPALFAELVDFDADFDADLLPLAAWLRELAAEASICVELPESERAFVDLLSAAALLPLIEALPLVPLVIDVPLFIDALPLFIDALPLFVDVPELLFIDGCRCSIDVPLFIDALPLFVDVPELLFIDALPLFVDVPELLFIDPLPLFVDAPLFMLDEVPVFPVFCACGAFSLTQSGERSPLETRACGRHCRVGLRCRGSIGGACRLGRRASRPRPAPWRQAEAVA
jgi:hypothetical protein